ncbi:cytosolic factor, phosphatidylinositol/phosphatidylcholine transfer protein [Microbotryomycetes sp. JL221]|nr:cytosolic factor, phosphatidylinositol/phosphatidylcholine transfer protein [Microbotryomycetes sp. JL221]
MTSQILCQPRIDVYVDKLVSSNDNDLYEGLKSPEVPVALSTMPKLTSTDKYAVLDKFKQELAAEGFYDSMKHDDAWLLRFLSARDYDLTKAKKMWIDSQNWRVEFGVDELYDSFEFKESVEVDKWFPRFYHKVDKDGCPIYVQQVGKLDMKQLDKHTSMDRLTQHLVVEYEHCHRVRWPTCTRIKGRLVETTCTILDCKGVSLTQFWKIRHQIQTAAIMSQNNYPSTMGRFYIINAPWAFSTAWSVVKGWLDEATVVKINILGSDYQHELLRHIDQDCLPTFLGGTCSDGSGGSSSPPAQGGEAAFDNNKDHSTPNSQYEPKSRPLTPQATLLQVDSPVRSPSPPTISVITTGLGLTALSRRPLSADSIMSAFQEAYYTPIEPSPPDVDNLGTPSTPPQPLSTRSNPLVVGYQSPTEGSVASFESLEAVERLPFVPKIEQALTIEQPSEVAISSALEPQVVDRPKLAVTRPTIDGANEVIKLVENLDEAKQVILVERPMLDSRRSSITTIKSSPLVNVVDDQLIRSQRQSAPSPALPGRVVQSTITSFDGLKQSFNTHGRIEYLKAESRRPSPARQDILVPIPIGVTTSEDSSDDTPQMRVPTTAINHSLVAPHMERYTRGKHDVKGQSIVSSGLVKHRPASPRLTRSAVDTSRAVRSQPPHQQHGATYRKKAAKTISQDQILPPSLRESTQTEQMSCNVKVSTGAASSLDLLQQIKQKIQQDESWVYVLKGLVAEYEESKTKQQGKQATEEKALQTSPYDSPALSDTEIDVRLLTPRRAMEQNLPISMPQGTRHPVLRRELAVAPPRLEGEPAVSGQQSKNRASALRPVERDVYALERMAQTAVKVEVFKQPSNAPS